MGIWGAEAFENDTALDWVGMNSDEKNEQFIIKNLERIKSNSLSKLDMPDFSVAFAAAYTVLLLVSEVSDASDFEVDLIAPLKGNFHISQSLIDLVIHSLEKILIHRDEVAPEFEDEDEFFEEWLSEIQKLRDNLIRFQ